MHDDIVNLLVCKDDIFIWLHSSTEVLKLATQNGNFRCKRFGLDRFVTKWIPHAA